MDLKNLGSWKMKNREDKTTIYLYVENEKFSWSKEKMENTDFEIIRLENYKRLNSLIKEKGLSKDDLTLILQTIKLPF